MSERMGYGEEGKQILREREGKEEGEGGARRHRSRKKTAEMERREEGEIAREGEERR